MAGTSTNLGPPLRRVNYWRLGSGTDLDGLVARHDLASTRSPTRSSPSGTSRGCPPRKSGVMESGAPGIAVQFKDRW